MFCTGGKDIVMPFSEATCPSESICLACALPYTANKFFSQLCYFEVWQNGACEQNVSMEPATHFDLERYSRLWTDRRCGRSRLALSETIHVLLWVKVSPEMDQGQNSTRVGRNHLSRDILPF